MDLEVQEEELLTTIIVLIQQRVRELWDKVTLEVELQMVAMILETQVVVEALVQLELEVQALLLVQTVVMVLNIA